MAKGLRLKVREFWELIHTFVKFTVEKLVGGEGGFLAFLSPVLMIFALLLSCVYGKYSKNNLKLHCLFQFLHLLLYAIT